VRSGDMVYSIDEVVGGFGAENLRELVHCEKRKVPPLARFARFGRDDRVRWNLRPFTRRTREAGSSAAAPVRNDISLCLRSFVDK